MRHYDSTFFVERKEGIKVKIKRDNSDPYQFTVTITASNPIASRPAIVFYMEEECFNSFYSSIVDEVKRISSEEKANDL